MITIKEVRSEKMGLMGWEVWVCDTLFLVWADQSVLPGLRCSSCNQSFVPAIGDTMTHKTLFEVRE